MTNEQAKEIVKRIKGYMGDGECWSESEFMAMDMAIKALSQEPTIGQLFSCEEVEELRSKIWKQVEQEPCEDVVSRKAVLEQIFYSTDNDGDVVLGSTLRRRIENLPSVTPKSETVTEFADRCRECGARYGKLLEQKSGKWIIKEDNTSYVKTIPRRWAECSCCKWSMSPGYVDRYAYCPNCGECKKDGRTLGEFIEDSKESEEK